MSGKPHRIVQNEWNELLKDLKLPKSRTEVRVEILTMETVRWQSESVCVPFFPKYLTQFFKMEGNIEACNNADGMVKAL
jgi:hypothetical protein